MPPPTPPLLPPSLRPLFLLTRLQVKAHYYTDNHEALAVIQYRDAYVARCMARELKSPEWVLMSVDYATTHYPHLILINDPHNAHFYNSSNTSAGPADMVEFHVDLDDNFFRGIYPGDPDPEYLKYKLS